MTMDKLNVPEYRSRSNSANDRPKNKNVTLLKQYHKTRNNSSPMIEVESLLPKQNSSPSAQEELIRLMKLSVPLPKVPTMKNNSPLLKETKQNDSPHLKVECISSKKMNSPHETIEHFGRQQQSSESSLLKVASLTSASSLSTSTPALNVESDAASRCLNDKILLLKQSHRTRCNSAPFREKDSKENSEPSAQEELLRLMKLSAPLPKVTTQNNSADEKIEHFGQHNTVPGASTSLSNNCTINDQNETISLCSVNILLNDQPVYPNDSSTKVAFGDNILVNPENSQARRKSTPALNVASDAASRCLNDKILLLKQSHRTRCNSVSFREGDSKENSEPSAQQELLRLMKLSAPLPKVPKQNNSADGKIEHFGQQHNTVPGASTSLSNNCTINNQNETISLCSVKILLNDQPEYINDSSTEVAFGDNILVNPENSQARRKSNRPTCKRRNTPALSELGSSIHTFLKDPANNVEEKSNKEHDDENSSTCDSDDENSATECASTSIINPRESTMHTFNSREDDSTDSTSSSKSRYKSFESKPPKSPVATGSSMGTFRDKLSGTSTGPPMDPAVLAFLKAHGKSVDDERAGKREWDPSDPCSQPWYYDIKIGDAYKLLMRDTVGNGVFLVRPSIVSVDFSLTWKAGSKVINTKIIKRKGMYQLRGNQFRRPNTPTSKFSCLLSLIDNYTSSNECFETVTGHPFKLLSPMRRSDLIQPEHSNAM